MNRKYVVRQNGYKDCGPSCLLSIMKYYGLDVSHEEVSYLLKVDERGTNAFNIINGSKTLGFDGYGCHYTYEQIINGEISFPIICHVMKNNMYHFIVIYGIKRKHLIVMDPASSVDSISFNEFKSIYLNTSLVIYPVKNICSIEKSRKLYDYIFDFIKLYKGKSIKIVILSLIIIFIGIFSNWYTMIGIDYVIPNYSYKLLVSITVVFLFSYIFNSILSFIRNRHLISIENDVSIKINEDIVRKVFNLPYQFFKSKSTGEVISRLNDLKAFKESLSVVIVKCII